MFKFGLWNVWWLYLPLCGIGFMYSARFPLLARRMADMGGYSRREKIITVAASLLPYPYMLAAFGLPWVENWFLIVAGAIAYLIGLSWFTAALEVMATTPADRPFDRAVYRRSRNPLYVAASLIFLSALLVTASIVLFVGLALILILQHGMIKAEERVCRLKYGADFEKYLREVPRYIRLPVPLVPRSLN